VRAGNCIIAHNDGVGVDGTLFSLGHNLFSDSGGIVTNRKTRSDFYGMDPRLGPLQDNGGFTPTHALLEGSPAIDAGFANRLKEDQRGQIRKRNLPTAHNGGDGSDIGAYEYQPIHRGVRAGLDKDKPSNSPRRR
jgi:hypothetical protein